MSRKVISNHLAVFHYEAHPLQFVNVGNGVPLEEALKTMREGAAKFNVEKIKPQDLAGAGGPPDEET
jgi:hypothetical protein